MAFGQSSGFPASHRQVQRLTELVSAAGHRDFRDARGPLGLTQRQAAGKFTSTEADELIARLEAEAEAVGDSGASAPAEPPAPARRSRAPRPAALEQVPSELLAAELQRRGWIVCEP